VHCNQGYRTQRKYSFNFYDFILLIYYYIVLKKITGEFLHFKENILKYIILFDLTIQLYHQIKEKNIISVQLNDEAMKR